MKRYMYVVLAATLILSACSNGNTKTESETAAVETEVTEGNKADERNTTESTEEEESGSGENSELLAQEVVYYAPLDVGLAAEYEGEWDENGPIITADSSMIIILDDGYERLKETIQAYNKRNWQEVLSLYTEHLDFAKEDLLPEGTEISISRAVEVTRADSKVLSFINAETAFLGGAHGSYYENTETFDAETGEALALTDVITDLDAVYQYVKKSLEENYEKEMFFEGYEEWLEEMFYEPGGAMSSPLEWVLTMEGMEFRFSPYVLGPWVSGTFEVKMPYVGNEALFAEEYLFTLEHPIRKIKPDEEYYLDMNGDGAEDKVMFAVEWDEETYSSTLMINRVCENADRTISTSKLVDHNIYGTFQDAYLMYSADEVPYLYIEFLGDNDWRFLEIVQLADTEHGQGPVVLESIGNGVYGNFISDPSRFVLHERLYILGTYTAYKHYAVGEDGMPVSEEELYTIASYDYDWECALTSRRAIPVLMHEEGSDQKVEETLPKGTKFRPRKTDGKTVVEMELEDGRRCDILVERSEDDFTYYIDGVSEYDCFVDVPYAG